MASKFAIGTKVLTHSLSAAEFNGLSGTVTGAVVRGQNKGERVPVTLHLTNGTHKDFIHTKHLIIIDSVVSGSANPDLDLQMQFCNAIAFGNLKKMMSAVRHGADVNYALKNITPVWLLSMAVCT